MRRRGHSCTYYCVDDVHAIPVCAVGPWEKSALMLAWSREETRLYPEHSLVDMFPAREADLATWLRWQDWEDEHGHPAHPPATSRPWIALVRMPEVPAAARGREEDA